MENRRGQGFGNGFLLGLIVGASLVFFLFTKKGKEWLKLIQEEGLEGIAGLAGLLEDEEEIQVSKVSKVDKVRKEETSVSVIANEVKQSQTTNSSKAESNDTSIKDRHVATASRDDKEEQARQPVVPTVITTRINADAMPKEEPVRRAHHAPATHEKSSSRRLFKGLPKRH